MDREPDIDRIRDAIAEVQDPIALLVGFFAHAPFGLQIYRADGQSMLVNQAFLELFGSAPPPEYNVLRDELADAAGVLPLIRRAFRGEVVHMPPIWYDARELKQVKVEEGRRVAIVATLFPLFDQRGAVNHVAIIFRDVTNELGARHDAELQRERLEAVLRQMPAGVLIVEATRGRVLLASALAKEILGVAEVPPEWFSTVTGKFLALDGSPLPIEDLPLWRAIHGGESSSGRLVRYQRPDGARLVLRKHASPVRDKGGVIVAGVLALHDVTAQRRADEAQRFLARAGEILASSLDWEATLAAVARLAVPEIADWCAVDLPVDEGGSQQLAVAHADPAKLELAHELRRRWPPDPNASGGAGEAMRTGRSILIREITEETIIKGARDAEHLRVIRELGLRSAMVAPLMARGRTLGTISFVSAESGRLFDEVDLALAEELARRAALAVDNARLYREAQDATRAREAFLSIASHELKTPLTSVQLQVQNLLRQARRKPEGYTLDRVAEVTEKIESQVMRLAKLVEDLLEVSRIAAGRLSIIPAEVDLASVAREAVARLADELARSGSTVTVRGAETLVGQWDRARLEQVTINLLSNAIKYGQGRPIEVAVERHKECARLSVTDQGIGIEKADQARIFGRFERAGEGLKYAGSGLGLWIVRQIVEAMGGTVRVASEVEKGSSFTVELPFAPRRRSP